MNKTNVDTAKIFKAFCDPKRLAILDLLKSGEKCACVLLRELNTTQSGLSYHMKILCESGIVNSRQEGKWTHYSLNPKNGRNAARLLTQLTTPFEISKEKECILKGESNNMENKTQLYVLTGFLGSGKTTILLKLLDVLTKQGKKVGVIQNEFGKLNIDGEILKNDDIKMVEINRGSIFCSCLRLTFVQALSEMAEHHFDYLFIESSGLGDPSNILEILEASAVLSGETYRFKGAVCLVDSVNFFDQLNDLETVYRQLKHCHLAILTKTDLVDEKRISELEEQVRKINPVCEIITSANANLDLSFLTQDLLKYQWAESEETTNTVETKPKTLFMDFDGEVDEEKLKNFISSIWDDLYRAKGFFHLSKGGWSQVDLVGHRIDIKPCDPKEISQFVFISKTGPMIIKKIIPLWEEKVGLPMKLRN